MQARHETATKIKPLFLVAREAKQAWIRLCGRYTGGVSGANTPGTKVLVAGGDFTREVGSNYSQFVTGTNAGRIEHRR